MSFVQNGITFFEPGDLSLITNPAQITGLLAYSGNTLYRTDKSMWSLDTHNHTGKLIYPNGIYSTVNYLYIQGKGDGTGFVRVSGGSSGNDSIILMYGANAGANAGKMILYSTGQIALTSVVGQTGLRGTNPLANYALTLPNTDNGKVIAKEYVLHASDVKNKENIVPIDKDAAKSALKKVDAITYTDKDEPNVLRTGVTAQDLENTGLPDIVDKNDKGEYIGINPIKLVYLLLEEVKALREELDAIKLIKVKP